MNYPSPDLQLRCPVCDAAPGQRCRSLNQKLYAKPRAKVHPERRAPRADLTTTAAAKAMRAARPEQYQKWPLPAAVGHGTVGRYASGCRCDECREAHGAVARERRRKLQGSLAADDSRHGTKTAYDVYGCRCDRCREAMSAYKRALYRRTRAAASRAVTS